MTRKEAIDILSWITNPEYSKKVYYNDICEAVKVVTESIKQLERLEESVAQPIEIEENLIDLQNEEDKR